MGAPQMENAGKEALSWEEGRGDSFFYSTAHVQPGQAAGLQGRLSAPVSVTACVAWRCRPGAQRPGSPVWHHVITVVVTH